jgi:hypothetical protein
VKATDAGGAAVCDSVAKPAFPTFGGVVGDQTFAQGEPYRESFVLNPVCPSLGSPGDLHVTLHRRVSRMGMHTPQPGSTTPLSCDIHPIHEGPLRERYPAACVEMMDTLPSITTELDIHVDPFDAGAVRAATAARLAEAAAARPKDEMGRARIADWVCGWLACGCHAACGCPAPAPGVADADLLDALPAALPAKFPAPCPR